MNKVTSNFETTNILTPPNIKNKSHLTRKDTSSYHFQSDQVLFVTDGAAYMKKAGMDLKALFPNILHVCHVHCSWPDESGRAGSNKK